MTIASAIKEPIKKPVAVTLPAPPTAEQPSQAAPATSRPVTGKPEEPTKKPTSQTAAPETPSLPNSFPTGTKKPTVTIDRPSQNPNRPSRPIVFPTRNPQGSPSQPIVFPTRAPVGSSRPGLLPFGISRPGSTPNRPPPVQEDTWSCQVGMAPCSARYQGSPWALVGESDQGTSAHFNTYINCFLRTTLTLEWEKFNCHTNGNSSASTRMQ